MASTPRTPTPALERSPPPVPTPRPPPPVETPPRPPVPLPTPPPPLETPPPPSPSSSQPGDEYHTPAPSLTDGSPREEASFPSDGNGREGGAPPKSPQLSPMRFAAPPLLLPPPSPRTRAGQNGEEEEGSAKAKAAAAETAAPAQQPLRLTGLARSPSSQRSLATTNSSPSPSPSPTPPSPLTPATPVVNSSGNNNNNNRSGQSTPRRAETKLPLPLSSPAAATATIAVHFNPAEEAVTSPLHLGGKARLDQHQQEQHSAAVAENGGSVPPDVAAVVAAGERRELSVTLRLATAVLSLAAFSVIASARTSGWAGDYYAHHLQYRYAVAVNVIVCAYSIAQSFGEIRRLISPNFMFRTMSSYYFSLFLDQALAYLLMSASSAAASRNDLWVSRFGTDAFNRKITSALWLSFIAFLMLALNALISTANLFSIA